MAYSDLNFFLPQQQYYRNPQDYTKAMKNAALQKATYLAQMDVEMAQLEEAKRQFNEGQKYNYKALGVQEDANRTQRALGWGGLAVAGGQAALGFMQNRQNLDWAENMYTKYFAGGGESNEVTSGVSQDILDFDIDAIDTSFSTDVWDSELASYSDPLLDYEFDMDFF